MPRSPDISPAVAAMRGGIFSAVAHRIASLEGEVYPLHVGDTWMEPPPGARMEDQRVAAHPGMHRYGPLQGLPALVSAIAARREIDPGRLLISAGATAGLDAVCRTLLEPGDEVLLLAPYWPLIRGIVSNAAGVPVDVPFFGLDGTVEQRLEAKRTDRTVALYVNTPNNPTGAVLTAEELAQIAAFARRHNLWILSDEVYERYAFQRGHVSLAPMAPERCFTAFSFSKAYGMAGNRLGYLVGPSEALILEVRKVSTHTWYAAPTAAQLAGLAAIEQGEDWLDAARRSYQDTGDRAAALLGLPPPEGGTFLFFDVAHRLDARGLQGFLWDCLDDNLILAPGPSFGHDYGTWVRLCFTAVPPEVTLRGVEKLARRLRG